MKSDRADLATLLERFGAPRDGVVALDASPGPEHIRYLDLLRSALPDDARPAAVVELRGRPVIFVARGDRPLRLPPLRRALALRADGAFLGIVEPGRLRVRTVELNPESEQEILVASIDDPNAATVIPELALRPPKTTEQVTAVHNLLFSLLDSATAAMAQAGLPADDALSLAGRALFLRFLVDRSVIGPTDVRHVCSEASSFEQCFDTTENLAATSRWLDRTFNGDLLPLTSAVDGGDANWLPRLSASARKRVSNTLTLIMHRAEPSGQLRLDWGDLDFAHVPTGLLSQVYERHSQRYYNAARETSVYYTPRSIAEYMVAEAFAAMDEPHSARVLDPAVGGGVFLVAAFRRLVEARWRHDGRRPTTRTIRSILNRQLAGFEINEAALRLTALSLYLTALELDPHPHPITELRFQNLRGVVLFDVNSNGGTAYQLGSLGPAVTRHHDGAYDLVIGNPPWTALKRNESYRAAMLDGIRPIARERLGPARAANFTIPDDVPDLAFVWRSLGWAKPHAHVAFAVHGRLLFKQAPAGRQARADLFQAFRVTGILNGAALRQTDVWPDVDAPFALIFGRNELPPDDNAFYFVSPDREDLLNRRGAVRIDPAAATIVQQKEAIRTPYILKTLFRGTTLDLAVIEKISAHAPLSLEEYWKNLGLHSGHGFQLGGSARAQQSAGLLHGLPRLTKTEFDSYRIRTTKLPRFTRPTLLYPRRREIYRAPLVLVPKTPSPERAVPRAAIALDDVAFNESFYGYSAAGHKNAELLARYLLLILNSDLPIYLALLTSGQFGTERDALYKADLEQLPIRPLAELTTAQTTQVKKLSDSVLAGTAEWNDINAFVAQLYGLNRWDREVMRDTLAVAAPFAGARRRAQQRSSDTDINAFARRLAHDLRPFIDGDVDVRRAATDRSVPWVWLAVGPVEPDLDTRPLVRAATDLAATQIIACTKNGGVAIGILNQQRYWTPTRARLLALQLLHDDEISESISHHVTG